jgi:hypothetical protein
VGLIPNGSIEYIINSDDKTLRIKRFGSGEDIIRLPPVSLRKEKGIIKSILDIDVSDVILRDAGGTEHRCENIPRPEKFIEELQCKPDSIPQWARDSVTQKFLCHQPNFSNRIIEILKSVSYKDSPLFEWHVKNGDIVNYNDVVGNFNIDWRNIPTKSKSRKIEINLRTFFRDKEILNLGTVYLRDRGIIGNISNILENSDYLCTIQTILDNTYIPTLDNASKIIEKHPIEPLSNDNYSAYTRTMPDNIFVLDAICTIFGLEGVESPDANTIWRDDFELMKSRYKVTYL